MQGLWRGHSTTIRCGILRRPESSGATGFPLGSRQVVRHRILIPAFVGSIPTSPANPDGHL